MSRPKHFLLPLLERLTSRGEIQPGQVDLTRIDRVLVIKQHDMLGDFLLATPVFRALRKTLPQASIGVVAKDYSSDTVQYHPHVDEMLEIPREFRRWTAGRFVRFIRRLRANWDLVIVLNTVSHSVTSDLLAWWSNARWVLGSDVFLFPGCRRNFFYNLIAPSQPGVRHQSERNLDIVRYIGIDTDNLSEEIGIRQADVELARTRLKTKNGCLIGVHIGAGKVSNRWPVKSFARLMERLNETLSASFAVFWGPAEETLMEELKKALRFQPGLVPPSTVRQLANNFAACNLVVCNDTGAMHLCASVGTPLVALFGPTNPHEWKPIGEKFAAIRGKDNTLASIGVDEVFSAVVESIKRFC